MLVTLGLFSDFSPFSCEQHDRKDCLSLHTKANQSLLNIAYRVHRGSILWQR